MAATISNVKRNVAGNWRTFSCKIVDDGSGAGFVQTNLRRVIWAEVTGRSAAADANIRLNINTTTTGTSDGTSRAIVHFQPLTASGTYMFRAEGF